MQKTFYKPADAEVSLSDNGCRSLSFRQRMHQRHSISKRMQESLYQTANAGDTLSDSGCQCLSIGSRHSITADAGVSLSQRIYQRMQESDSGCRRHSIRQRMHSLYQTADAGDTLSAADAGVSAGDTLSGISIRQRLHLCLYQTADAGDTLSDSGCRGLFIRQWMQETL